MPVIDTSDEACAVACTLVSNPQGALRKDGDSWQQRVNDLIRALRDERNTLAAEVERATEALHVIAGQAHYEALEKRDGLENIIDACRAVASTALDEMYARAAAGTDREGGQ